MTRVVPAPRVLSAVALDAVKGAFAASTISRPGLLRAEAHHALQYLAREVSTSASDFDRDTYNRNLLELAAIALRLLEGPIQNG